MIKHFMALRDFVNPNIVSLTPYQPGLPIEEVAREQGLDPGEICKLASNESALGASPKAIEAYLACATELHMYPDGGAWEIRHKLAEFYDLNPDQFILGCGSNEILELVGHCFLNETSSVVYSQYSFVVYQLVAKLFGAKGIEVPATDGLGHDLAAIRAAIQDDTRIVFVCTPNNPTGTMFSAKEFEAFIENWPQDVLLVLDEAYAEIALGSDIKSLQYLSHEIPLLITRTFSKAYGLAGLRLGYGISSPALIETLSRARQPFNVTLPALKAGLAAIEDQNFIHRSQDHYSKSCAVFEKFFKKYDIPYIPSGANFILVQTGNGQAVFEALMEKGVIVRPMATYKLPEHIRISYGTDKENQKAIDALIQVLSLES
ncbi:MAG: histidinol-phosphate transaminase [Lentisphaeria bacterium]|nr:histidinol-phosphate transaminase [Lentisphaeria bacterium]